MYGIVLTTIQIMFIPPYPSGCSIQKIVLLNAIALNRKVLVRKCGGLNVVTFIWRCTWEQWKEMLHALFVLSQPTTTISSSSSHAIFIPHMLKNEQINLDPQAIGYSDAISWSDGSRGDYPIRLQSDQLKYCIWIRSAGLSGQISKIESDAFEL